MWTWKGMVSSFYLTDDRPDDLITNNCVQWLYCGLTLVSKLSDTGSTPVQKQVVAM